MKRNGDELHESGLTRREFFEASAVLGLGAVAATQLGPFAGRAFGASKPTIKVSSWTAYMDKKLLKPSGDKIGATVKYVEDINSNEEWFAKADPKLRRNQSIDRDGVVLTDWMISRVLQLRYMQKLDAKSFPNKKNLLSALRSPSFDKGRVYSVPWQTGITGVAYNAKTVTKPITTMDDFFSKDLKGQITVLDEKRDTIGLIMLSLGQDPSTTDYAGTEKAFQKLEQLSADGIIRGVNGNEYVNDLSQGHLAACLAWSGDVAQIARENPDIKFVIPDSGGMLWADNFTIPKTSKQAKLASKWINYWYDPKNAARLTASIQYISPVNGVADQLTKMGGDAAKLVDDPLVVPTPEMKQKLHIFNSLSESDEAKFDARWAKALGQ